MRRFRKNIAISYALVTVAVGLYTLLECVRLFHRPHWKKEAKDFKTIQENIAHFQGLNQHAWERNCLLGLEQLCNFPVFPRAPDRRTFVETVNISASLNPELDGFRLLGFLRPNVTGEYLFFVSSNGFAEVWLSTNINWENGKKIAYAKPTDAIGFEAIKPRFSNGIILLSAQRYYIEILYARGMQKKDPALVQLAWKIPGKIGFELIDSSFFTPLKNDSDNGKMKVYDDDLPDALACKELRLKVSNKHMRTETLPHLESVEVNRALEMCEYRPSYLLDPANLRGFRQFHGVRVHAHKTFSFPYTHVDGIIRNPAFRQKINWLAEDPLDEQEAQLLVKRYIGALEKHFPGKYKLEFIKRVEKKVDPQKGARYLLELVVKDLTDGKNYILERYVFQSKENNTTLCYPEGLQWNRTTDVYLILTAKNLGRWVHHFIKNVEKIVQQTKDEHLHVVIYDYESPDIDLKQAFQRSTIKNYHYITKPGKYSRVESFSEAVQSIKNKDAIFVTIDLHLDIGSQMIDDVRKHCFKGRTVYAPQIAYLHCGGSSTLPKGVWYHYSYGTIAMYKQDWDNFGGFSEKYRNKTTWGGEDWDIIDGAVKGGLEIERKRSPNIYHYHHTKAGMWA